MILPDDLRPINMVSGEGIDVINGTLGIYSRMNFGQVCECIISKGIQQSEKQILSNENNIPRYLSKLSKLALNLNRPNYANEIQSLANDSSRHQELLQSIHNGGLYFEAPSFANINVSQLRDFVENEFGIKLCEPIKIKRETFKYIKQKCKIDLPIPNNDLIYPKIFNSSVYFLKLMQLAESKLTARDFGSYSATNRQPVKDRVGNSTGSRLGSMEFDGLISHNVPHIINELRTVKSDCIGMKKDLVNQMIYHGFYHLPTVDRNSYTKLIIDQMIVFLNN